MSDNPFLDRSFEIRWSQLKPELVEPAIREAIARAKEAVEGIASIDLGKLSFENTFLGLERATEELGEAWGKVAHLQSVADSPALRDAHNAVLPEVSAFFAGIPLNAELWKRLRAFADTPAASSLVGVKKRFLEETVADFRQAGADLPDDKRKRLEELQGELALITQTYSENVLDSTNAWQLIIEDESRLVGLPERAKAAARRSAEQKKYGDAKHPAWRFTLQGTSVEPVMNYAEDAELRRTIWSGSANIGSIEPYDNSKLIPRILALRAEKAALLGFSHFADLVLARRMAKRGAQALEFIEDLQKRAQPFFRQEISTLEAYRAEQTGTAPGLLKIWELRFWAERLRKQRYAFDAEILRPYFPMDRVVQGMFEIVGRVFGIAVTERPAGSVDLWHSEVKFYDVRDESGRHVGSFYADWHPRESKRGGAWQNSLITGGLKRDGTLEPHLGLICGNLTPPVDGKPALLTHREVETIFHEFGHLLHHLLGKVEIKSLNGTNVAWDFVELPSQILENWCWEREGLDLFARHHESGEAIPEELYAKLLSARNFRSGSAVMHQAQLAKMDLLLHLRTEEFGSGDIEAKMRAATADMLTPSDPPAQTIMRRFTHIFGDAVGYAAGYYSYKWAEVLDADAFTRFKKEGLFNRKTGAEFVEHILSMGNSEDPAVLFHRFMGREPDPQALLIRSGLVR